MIEMAPLWISSGLLLGGAVIGVWRYTRVVAKGYRALSHVVFAFAGLAVVGIVATLAVRNDGVLLRGFLFIGFVLLICAMAALAGRFR